MNGPYTGRDRSIGGSDWFEGGGKPISGSRVMFFGGIVPCLFLNIKRICSANFYFIKNSSIKKV